MKFVSQWFEVNLDIVFFIYGLAFVLMGIVILVQPRKGSEFRLSGVLWLLAIFGITHGANEFFDMWSIIKGRNPSLDIFRLLLLVVSYFFLFEFGRQVLNLHASKTPLWQRAVSKVFPWWGMPIAASIVILTSVFSSDPWLTGSIFMRYLLGLPGGILIGLGLMLNYRNAEEIYKPMNVKKYFFMLSFVFIMYSVLGGLIVPKANFPPASWLNVESFHSVAGIPVQVFRAVCAIVAAWATGGLLTIFNWEMKIKFEESEKKLKLKLRESEDKYAEVVNDSADMFIFIDIDGFITFVNKQAYSRLCYSDGELIGRHIREIYDPDTWEDVETGLKKLDREGALFIDNGKMIDKTGKKLDVEIHSMAIYDRGKSLFGARLSVRDITERIKLEKELTGRIKELQEFYDIAIESELRMIKLKEEIKKLRRELRRDDSG